MRDFSRSVGAFILLFLAISSSGQSSTDFTGRWREETNSSTQHQLDVEQNGRSLIVKTVTTNPQGARDLEVKYEIGGPETTYTGLDGDQFRSSVNWDGSSLVFNTIEHENGRDIREKTVWTLSSDRNALRTDKESLKKGDLVHTLTTYDRQAVH